MNFMLFQKNIYQVGRDSTFIFVAIKPSLHILDISFEINNDKRSSFVLMKESHRIFQLFLQIIVVFFDDSSWPLEPIFPILRICYLKTSNCKLVNSCWHQLNHLFIFLPHLFVPYYHVPSFQWLEIECFTHTISWIKSFLPTIKF